MKNETGAKRIFRLTWLAFAVSLISLALFVGVIETSGETSLGFWFILFLLLLFVSAPVHAIVLIGSLIQLVQGNGRAFRWVYIYLIVAVSGHVAVAASQGAFEGIYNEIVQYKRSIDEPAQVKLEHAFRSGSVSNIRDVQDALAGGANPDAGILDNRIPFLVVAARTADTPVIKVLLDAGADPDLRASTEYGLGFQVALKNPLPLDVVAFSDSNSMLDSVELLLAAGADPSQSVMKLGACRRGDLPLYDLARAVGASGLLDAKDQTCLHHAAATNQVGLLNALLFDPAYDGENARALLLMSNHIGQYPLDTAIAGKHYEAALVIVKAGGGANKEWTVERALNDQSHAPFLDELQALLLRDQ
jgi:ankyrin repeat protein